MASRQGQSERCAVWRAANADKSNGYKTAWRRANPEKAKEAKRREYARRKAVKEAVPYLADKWGIV